MGTSTSLSFISVILTNPAFSAFLAAISEIRLIPKPQETLVIIAEVPNKRSLTLSCLWSIR